MRLKQKLLLLLSKQDPLVRPRIGGRATTKIARGLRPTVDAIEASWSDEGPPHAQRRHVPVLDKAIALTWTFRDNSSWRVKHLELLDKRFVIEYNAPTGEPGRQQLSNLISRSLRALKWPPGPPPDDEAFYKAFFLATLRLQQVGVHQGLAEELFRKHYHDMEARVTQEGWVAWGLCMWTACALNKARPQMHKNVGVTPLIAEAKAVGARAVPLLGGPWGEYARADTCKVSLVGRDHARMGPSANLSLAPPLSHGASWTAAATRFIRLLQPDAVRGVGGFRAGGDGARKSPAPARGEPFRPA
jgi:hypothetical protein